MLWRCRRMNAGEECSECGPISPRMTSMRGRIGVSMKYSWERPADDKSSAGTASVRARLAAIGLSRLVLFLDFDGTIVPIGARPEKVRLSNVMAHALDRLGRRLPIAVVSGRRGSPHVLRAEWFGNGKRLWKPWQEKSVEPGSKIKGLPSRYTID